MDWDQISHYLQTGAAVLLPVLAWAGKMYTDNQRMQMGEMIQKETNTTRELIEKVKKDITETVTNINLSLTANKTADEYRDKELRRLAEELNHLKRK